MATDIIVRDKATFAGMLAKPEFQQAIMEQLPKHIGVTRFTKSAMIAFSRTPKLAQCTQLSIMQALMTSAQLGLDCSGVLGSGYLIPYKDTCVFIAGYRGLIDLARRSGEIASIEARCVYQKDHFEEEYGTDMKLVHRPYRDGDAGPMKLVYAKAVLRDGATQIEVMSKAQVDRIRASSRAGQSGPWVDHYDEMARKTVVRRICKYLPISTELEAALAAEDEIESTSSIHIDTIEPGESRTDRLTKRLTAKPAPASESTSPAPQSRPDDVASLPTEPEPETNGGAGEVTEGADGIDVDDSPPGTAEPDPAPLVNCTLAELVKQTTGTTVRVVADVGRVTANEFAMYDGPVVLSGFTFIGNRPAWLKKDARLSVTATVKRLTNSRMIFEVQDWSVMQ